MSYRSFRSVMGMALLSLSAICASTSPDTEMSATATARTDTPRITPAGTLLPSGWVLHPAGRQIRTGDLPLSMTLSPDGRYVLVTTGGYMPAQTLAINVYYEQLQTTQTLDQNWEGMTFSPDGKQLYVSGGGRALIWRYDYSADGGDLLRKDPLPVADLTGRDAPYARHGAPIRTAGSAD